MEIPQIFYSSVPGSTINLQTWFASWLQFDHLEISSTVGTMAEIREC